MAVCDVGGRGEGCQDWQWVMEVARVKDVTSGCGWRRLQE